MSMRRVQVRSRGTASACLHPLVLLTAGRFRAVSLEPTGGVRTDQRHHVTKRGGHRSRILGLRPPAIRGLGCASEDLPDERRTHRLELCDAGPQREIAIPERGRFQGDGAWLRAVQRVIDDQVHGELSRECLDANLEVDDVDERTLLARLHPAKGSMRACQEPERFECRGRDDGELSIELAQPCGRRHEA